MRSLLGLLAPVLAMAMFPTGSGYAGNRHTAGGGGGGAALLLEDGSYLLLEDGSHLLLE